MVRIGMGSDNRIGKRFLFPGIGYGGSCFPKDVKALVHTSEEYQYDFQILKSVIGINEIQKRRLSRTIIEHFDKANGNLVPNICKQVRRNASNLVKNDLFKTDDKK